MSKVLVISTSSIFTFVLFVMILLFSGCSAAGTTDPGFSEGTDPASETIVQETKKLEFCSNWCGIIKKIKSDGCLQVLGEILILAGFFTFSEKKLDKLINISHTVANGC